MKIIQKSLIFLCAIFDELNLKQKVMKLIWSVWRRVVAGYNIQTQRNYRKMITSKDLAAATGVQLGVPMRIRADPAVTKLQTLEFKQIFSNELRQLIDIFQKHNFELRIAGGAVRDLIMSIQPKDIDLATTATPTQMKEMFAAENVRLINLNGEKHGTITPRIGEQNFEVTTLRIDVRTNGRHAEVHYTTDWQLDANRRDLTINSMFLGFDGTLYDYFYGYEDLQQRRVIFVGDANVRIQEDYLRILRYFRFYGRIAQQADKHDEPTLQAIRQHGKGLAHISGERKWQELQKILVGNFGCSLMKKILELELGIYCGLPEQANLKEFETVCEAMKLFEAVATTTTQDAILYMSSLLHTREQALTLHNTLKLSAYERDLMLLIVQQRHKISDEINLHACIVMCLQPNVRQHDVLQLLKYSGKLELFRELQQTELPKFPINGNIIKQQINIKGSRMFGAILNELRERWIQSYFQLTKEELLTQLPEVLEMCKSSDEKKESSTKRHAS